MGTSVRNDFTADERRIVRNWTRGVAAIYAIVCLLIIGFASLSHPSAGGSRDVIASRLVPPGAGGDRPSDR